MERRHITTLFLDGVEHFNDRTDFEDTTGEQPPPFDPSRPPKHWRSGAVGTSPVYKYQSIDRGKGTYFDAQIEAGMVSRLNLPGRYRYPDWNPKTTEAQTESGHRLGGGQICLESQALRLMEELGALGQTAGPFESKHMGGSRIIYPADEKRRVWSIVFKGRVHNGGLLLSFRNRPGVGYPGEWVDSDPDPMFRAITPVTKNALPSIAIPYRPLRGDERFVRDLMGNLAVGIGEPDSDEDGGGASLDALERIERKLDELMSLMLAKG
jgi:hypothetical protein